MNFHLNSVNGLCKFSKVESFMLFLFSFFKLQPLIWCYIYLHPQLTQPKNQAMKLRWIEKLMVFFSLLFLLFFSFFLYFSFFFFLLLLILIFFFGCLRIFKYKYSYKLLRLIFKCLTILQYSLTIH